MYFEEKKKWRREKQDQKVLFFKAKRQGSEIVPKETKLVKFYFPKLQPK